MGPRATVLAAVLLAAGALAGCVAPAGPGLQAAEIPDEGLVPLPALQVVEDAAGDASFYNGGVATDYGRYHCRFVGAAAQSGAVRNACWDAYGPLRQGPLDAVPRREGLPAPPAADILGVRIAETPETLLVTLEIAALDQAFTGLVSEDGSEFASFLVCWDRPEWPCRPDLVDLYTSFSAEWYDDELLLFADAGFTYAGSPDEGCNAWWWCAGDVPFEVQYGAPATITWEVPRAFFPVRDAGASLGPARAFAGKMPHTTDGPVDWVTINAPGGVHKGQRLVPFWLRPLAHMADEAGPGEPYAYRSELRWPEPGSGVKDLRRAPVSVGSGEPASPRADMERVELLETPRTLTVAVQLKEVVEPPHPAGFEFELGLPSRGLLYAWWGDSYHGAGVDGDQWVDVPVEVAVAQGAPGWVNLTFDRNDLGAPAKGDFLNLGEIDTWDDAVLASTYPGPVWMNASNSVGDWTYLDVFQFRYDTEAPEVESQARGADDLGDVDAEAVWPVNAGQWNPGQFDLTYVQAEVPEPGLARVSLGLQDLRAVEVPAGFQAVLYAAGMETPRGSFLVGYHKEQGQEAGDFFCAEDTLLFAPQPAVPPRDFWTLIEGVITLRQEADRDPGQGSGTGASITFLPPLACFAAGQEALEGQALRAGTYLLRRTPGQPDEATEVDRAAAEQPFRLEAAAGPAPPPPPWYVEPFGVSNFWDMLGLLAAGVVALLGVGALRRKRRALGRFLAEVERAAQLGKPQERERALVALRARLKEDLLRGRVTEAQYGIALGRVDEHLARARLEAFGSSFHALPHGVVLKLQALLRDGLLSREDHRVLAALVAEARLPPAARREVLQQLDRWLAEDATSGAPRRARA